ncbi:MAG: DUF3786 domain-containing protein [Desulfobacterota bacterium]|nr:DUF3786 domain-containing protein [Thermodesulfobacteriota bacterium]MDW8002465.1 DUF3786 domain-containing protein [Deltaproteobacteria bacterium]
MILYENITEEAFGLAIKMAQEKLAKMDVEDICSRTGSKKIDEERIMVSYLNNPYRVEIKTGRILDGDGNETLPLRDRIILLHYLTDAKGSPETGKLITYAQIEGGRFYFPVFHKRTVEPMVRFFSSDPEKLLEVSKTLGGQRERYGDLSISLFPLPLVRMYMILWKGDEDVPPNGNILFDKNITDYLCAEDIAVLTEIVTWKLIKSAKEK